MDFISMCFSFIVNFGIFICICAGFIVLKDSIKRSQTKSYFRSNIIYIKEQKYSNTKYPTVYKDVSKNDLAKFNTDDLASLKNYFYDIFHRFEVAYNNLDYATMKALSTKQVYQNYYTGISLDLKAGRKKIIDNIIREKVVLFELDSTSMKQTASMYVEISYFNYVVDKHGYVVRGNKHYAKRDKFVVNFRKDFNNKEIHNCPNCGAHLIDGKCSYCKSVLLEEEFKISAIKKIVE